MDADQYELKTIDSPIASIVIYISIRSNPKRVRQPGIFSENHGALGGESHPMRGEIPKRSLVNNPVD